MKEETKKKILKILAVINTILVIILMYNVYNAEMAGIDKLSQNYKKYEFWSMIFLIPTCISSATLIILAHILKPAIIHKKAPIIKINIRDYDHFESKLISTLYSDNYREYQKIENSMNCEIKRFKKNQYRILNVVFIIRAEEITEEILNSYFVETSIYAGKQIIFQIPYMIYIFCVDKKNDNFKKLMENTEVDYFVAGIDISTGEVHMSDHTGVLLNMYFEHMSNMFKKYISNQIQK